MRGRYKGHIGMIILRLYEGYIGIVMLGVDQGHIGVMEKKMEPTIYGLGLKELYLRQNDEQS